ncbi:hypothetical protein M1437_03770 [Patescibacteria group bacterium]|nr:hypothetical protein [Patescibacteria group bacterium]
MKKSILAVTGIVLSLLIANPQPVFAQMGVNRLVNQVQRVENQATRIAQRQEQNLDNLKKRADKMINNRVSSLNKLLQRIQNDKRLSTDEKTSLSGDVQANITGLTQLKAKIDADTDITTVRADTRSIITNFRIHAIFEPKIRLLVTINHLSALQGRLSSLTPKLQTLINNLKSQGKDVSKLQSLLDDINSNLSTINSKLSADKQTVLSISISSNPSVFAPVRQDLATVRGEFAQIRHDIGQMRVDFKIVHPSPSPI